MVKTDQIPKCYIFNKKQRKPIIDIMMRDIKLGFNIELQFEMISITSLDIVIPSLALFGFVLLY